eukprot:scaffold64157_cov22-Tisochrysis_lutea.AAC.1
MGTQLKGKLTHLEVADPSLQCCSNNSPGQLLVVGEGCEGAVVNLQARVRAREACSECQVACMLNSQLLLCSTSAGKRVSTLGMCGVTQACAAAVRR